MKTYLQPALRNQKIKPKKFESLSETQISKNQQIEALIKDEI